MGNINDIVQVNITRETKTVSRQGFGIPLIIGSNADFVERIRTYSSFSAVAEDFDTSDFEYKMAQKIFSQAIHPDKIKIGRCGAPIKMKVNIEITDVQDNTNYTVKINDTSFTIDSGTGATANIIVTALIAAISGGSEPVTCADNGANFDIEANTAGIDFSISISRNMTLKSVSQYTESLSDAFNAIRAEDDDFYFVLITNRTKPEIEELSAAVESAIKLFIACAFDGEIKTTGTTDIASLLKNAGYERTAVIYSEHPENCPDAAWVGLMAPKTPGQATWKFKALSGVTADNLSDTEISNILGKNCNIYDIIAGSNMTREGTVSSKEFIDTMRGIDWLKVNMQADVVDVLINQDKIPYTNAGVDVIRNKVLARLKLGVINGILKEDPAPEVNAPNVENIPQADRINRYLPDVKFFAYLKGAIHHTAIDGNISV